MERLAPVEFAEAGLDAEPLATSEAVRKAAKAETERPSPRSAVSQPSAVPSRAGEADDAPAEAERRLNLPRAVERPSRASEAAPLRPSDEALRPLRPKASEPPPGTAPTLPVSVTALEEPVGTFEIPVPSVAPISPTALHQPDARASDDGVRPPAPPVPARLAMPVWLERLPPASERHVQVGLGDDGSVRLRTSRQPDGITVQVHFSDPELQALAGVHADRLRAALETHFAEPVRLSLSDGLASDPGTSDSNSGFADSRQREAAPPSDARRSRPSGGDLSSPTPTQPSLNGRHEWVG